MLLLLLPACQQAEEGLFLAPDSGDFYPLWNDEWQGSLPQKPFPNNAFINDSGYIELHTLADAAYYADLLAAERFFSPLAPVYLPFSAELGAGWENLDGGSEALIRLINISPESPSLGQSVPYKVAAYSDAAHLFLEPLEPLAAGATYAVIVWRDLKDKSGNMAASPLSWINYPPQNEELKVLFDKKLMGKRALLPEEIAFMWSFTVRRVYRELFDAAKGIYGNGNLETLENHQPARLRFKAPETVQYTLGDGREVKVRRLAATLDSMELMGALGDYYKKEPLILSPYLETIKHIDIPYFLFVPIATEQPKENAAVIYPVTSDISFEVALIPALGYLASGYSVAVIALDVPKPQADGDLKELKNKWLNAAYHILQLERTLGKLNCASNMPYDFNGDGLPELAGDFDGDGQCEVSGKNIILAGRDIGASLAIIAGTVGKSRKVIAENPLSNFAAPAAENGYKLHSPLFIGEVLADFDPQSFLFAYRALLQELPGWAEEKEFAITNK